MIRATYSPITLCFGAICFKEAANCLDTKVDFPLTGELFENKNGYLFLGISVDMALYRCNFSGLISAVAFALCLICCLVIPSMICIFKGLFEKM